jgi:hypothetical protein
VALIDLLFGLLNGILAWPVWIAHLLGFLTEYPVYDLARNGLAYQAGFLLGAGAPFLGIARS